MTELKNNVVAILVARLNIVGATYNSMCVESGLTKSQLTLLLKHNGTGVTLDRLMVAIDKLGIDIKVLVEETKND